MREELERVLKRRRVEARAAAVRGAGRGPMAAASASTRKREREASLEARRLICSARAVGYFRRVGLSVCVGLPYMGPALVFVFFVSKTLSQCVILSRDCWSLNLIRRTM